MGCVRTLISPVCKSRYIALNRVECFLCAFYVFGVGIPFCGFLCEARVVEGLVVLGHACVRSIGRRVRSVVDW